MTDQDYILFEEYLSENLSAEAMATFENRLLNETEFNQAFLTYKELSGYLAHTFENEDKTEAFKNDLNTVSSNYFNQQKIAKKVIRFKPWQYAMAASVAIFIGLYSYNLFSVPTYGDFVSHNTISFAIRGTQNELLSNAENAFNNKNFTAAETYFTQLIQAEPYNQEFQLYKAISAIELNKFNDSKNILTKILQGNSAYKNKASWYLALSKLKQKDYNSCAEILKTIPADADDYKKAQKLLKKL